MTANQLIRHLSDKPGDFVVKTCLKKSGTVYSVGLRPLPREMVERLIAKKTLVAREESEQSFGLGERWL